jgi:hypothetical protein
MLASVVHFLWFLRYLLKSLPIVVGLQVELFLVGTAIWSWLRRFMPGRCNLFDINLVGLAVTVFFAQAWSLFGGLYPWSNGVLLSATLLCLLIQREAVIQVVRQAWNQTSWIGLAMTVPVLVVAAWNALTSAITCYDISAYHLQAVRWAAEFGSVPGLANLHGRLGFNSALHPLAALLSSPGGLWLGREYVNTSIVTMTMAILVQGIGRYSARSIYALMLLPFPTSLLFSDCLSSPQPDIAAASAVTLFAWYLRDVVLERESGGLSALFFGLVTATMAVLFKVSYLALGVTGIGVAIAYWTRSRQRTDQLVLLILFIGLFGLPWLFRGYLTSGYPFFPAEIGRLSFDWTTPHELIASERNWVLSWARAPFNLHWQQVLTDWSWVGPWIQQLPSYPIVIKAAGLAAVGLLASPWLLRLGYSRTQLAGWILIVSPMLSSLLFWFFSAPSPRFAQATIWILAVDLFYLGVIAANRTEVVGKLALLVCTTFMALEIIPGVTRLNAEPIQFPNYIGSAPQMLLLHTQSGAGIWVPKEGINSGDSKLPATPPDRFDPKLELRGPTLRDGFRIRVTGDTTAEMLRGER